MTISVSPELGMKLGSGMKTGNAIELPFVAPTVWVMNGAGNMKQVGGASFFGGWATKTEDFDPYMQGLGRADLPHGFVKTEMTTKDNKDLETYTVRSLIVAAITYRRGWILNGVRDNKFVKGARQHVQIIAYLASRTKDECIPYGPVMLSAKGFQAKNLLNAFGAWNKHSAALRAKIAPSVPSNLFYLAVGTFGAERKAVMVGADSQSAITPITAWLPENLKAETLESLFVGETVAQEMGFLLEQSEEWRKAWDQPQAEQMGPARVYDGPSDEYQWPTEPPTHDDIPF